MENSALVIVSGFGLFSFVIVVIATTLVKSWREGLDLGLKKFEKHDRKNIKKSFGNGDFPEEKRLKIAVKQYAKHQQIFISRQRSSIYMKTSFASLVVIVVLLLILLVAQIIGDNLQNVPLYLGTLFFLIIIFLAHRINQHSKVQKAQAILKK